MLGNFFLLAHPCYTSSLFLIGQGIPNKVKVVRSDSKHAQGARIKLIQHYYYNDIDIVAGWH